MGAEFDNLHQVLRTLYTEMMPMCGDMIGVAKGIAGLGALFYVALRVWQTLARAEPIDVYPLLRPFALGLCILFFPMVLETINGVLSPVVQGTHKMLEKHTLTKWQLYWKDQLSTWYGMFLHEAQYLEPVMRDIEAMLLSSQRNVTGTVELILRPRNYTLVGVDSTFDLMKTDFGEYGEVNKAWTADDVKGFTKILGNQIKIFYNVQKRNKK